MLFFFCTGNVISSHFGLVSLLTLEFTTYLAVTTARACLDYLNHRYNVQNPTMV